MLNERQKTFCRHYVRTQEAQEAARLAGYSPKSAHVTGCRLLKKPEVQAEIGKFKSKVTSKAILTAEETLANISGIAESGENENTRLRALELMAKHHSLLIERSEIVQRDEFDGLTPEQFKQVGPKLLEEVEEWMTKGLVS